MQESKESENDIDEDNEQNLSIETSLNQSSDTSPDASFKSNDFSPNKSSKKITIQLSQKVWHTIAPKEITSKIKREGSHKTGIRKYICLASGLWTNIFANEISKHDDIPCSWVFKRNKIYLSGDKFLHFEGKCKTCSATLIGLLKKKPEEDERVNISIQIYGIDSERHTKVTKKVKLTSKMADQIYLQKQTPTVITRNLLKTTTQMFKQPTSRTTTANAVRCAQYRNRLKEKLSTCPLTALDYLKSSNAFTNSIQRIGLDPFFVFYCTPEQQKLFHAFDKRQKILKVSCDATGGLVHKIGKFFSLFNKFSFKLI